MTTQGLAVIISATIAAALAVLAAVLYVLYRYVGGRQTASTGTQDAQGT
jgi:hypothetical protein